MEKPPEKQESKRNRSWENWERKIEMHWRLSWQDLENYKFCGITGWFHVLHLYIGCFFFFGGYNRQDPKHLLTYTESTSFFRKILVLCRKKKPLRHAIQESLFFWEIRRCFLMFSMEPPSKTNGWKLKIENGLRPKTPKKLLRFPEISFFQKKKLVGEMLFHLGQTPWRFRRFRRNHHGFRFQFSLVFFRGVWESSRIPDSCWMVVLFQLLLGGWESLVNMNRYTKTGWCFQKCF